MRVGFTGASGQGKTTTARALLNAPEFAHFDFVKSNIRLAKEHGYPLNEESTRLSQLLILCDRIGSESGYNGHSFITDRTALDFAAFTNVVGPDKEWDKFYYGVFDQLAQGWMKNYDHIFYFPFVIPVEENKFHSTDKNFHKKIDREIQWLLTDWDIPYTRVPYNSVEERVDFIRFRLWKERYKK